MDAEALAQRNYDCSIPGEVSNARLDGALRSLVLEEGVPALHRELGAR